MDAERQASARGADAEKDIALLRAFAAGQIPLLQISGYEILQALVRRYVAGLDDGR